MTISLLMDHLPDPVFIKDDQSRIIFANKAFLALYPPEKRDEVIGSTTVENFSPEEADTFLAEDRRALETGNTELVEEIVSYTGAKFVFKTHKIGFTTPTGSRRLLGICSDITELSQHENTLVELNTQLQAFSALAAHDLRSPLATFVSALNLVKVDKESSLSAKATGYIDMIIASATGLATTIASLLITSRASTTETKLLFRECDLNLLLAEVKFNLSHAISKSNARIYVNRLPHIMTEESLLRQLFQNLIENSIKYRSTDRPLKIFVKHKEVEGRHVFTVEDNGRGLGSSATFHAFEMYEQEQSKGITGVGIGLALCKRIVALHGGQIALDPTFTDGCRVKFDIPVNANYLEDEAVNG